MAAGAEMPAGPGVVSSNHSMLSRLVSCRWRDGGGEVENLSSLVSMGEWGGSNNWLCSSSMRRRALGSVFGGSVPSSRASSWWSEASATRLGIWATWTWGGGRDSAVLMGRVVTLAVTGRSLSVERTSWSRGEISAKGKMREDQNRLISINKHIQCKVSSSYTGFLPSFLQVIPSGIMGDHDVILFCIRECPWQKLTGKNQVWLWHTYNFVHLIS